MIRAMKEPRTDNEPASASAPGRFSLERLSSAFARLMGTTAAPAAKPARPQIAVDSDDELIDPTADAIAVTPRMIVEGMIFIGAEDGRPIPSAEIASHIRNVTPAEVDSFVVELNDAYERDGAAYRIATDSAGHRMQLREDLASVRERFRGQQRAAKLTPSALEVLSVVAYRQPVTSDEINKLRGTQSYAILAQLVRRKLVCVERPASGSRGSRYRTTDRFNKLFNVAAASDLPRSEDLADS
jgi:segregation and condensation protein B